MVTVGDVHGFVVAVAVAVAVAVVDVEMMMMEDDCDLYSFGDWSGHVDGPMLPHGVIPSAYSTEPWILV